LFVDESGDFDDPEAEVAVAGVLARTYDSIQMRLRLEQALRRAVPVGPYPPHANRLNIPAWLALAAMIRVESSDRGMRFQRWLAPAVDVITSSGESPAVQAREAVRANKEQGREVPWELVQNVDRWFRTDHISTYRTLRAASHDVDAEMVDLLRRLQANVLDGGRCFAAGAWSGPFELAPGDRYLALLEVLLERVFTLASASRLPVQLIHVHVATRGVRHSRNGTLEPMVLGDVDFALRGGTTFPTGCHPNHVQWFPRRPAHYDSAVHPGVVLADFVSNRLSRRVLCGSPDWDGVCARAGNAVGLPVAVFPRMAPGEPVPALAAAGPARRFIRDAFQGSEAMTEWEDVPDWVRQQARAWADLAGRLLAERKEACR
jgi:hypothetical protein